MNITVVCPKCKDRFQVDPVMRGRGVAPALMESTLRRLRLRGVVRIALMVRVNNQRARAFYEKIRVSESEEGAALTMRMEKTAG